MFMNRSLYMMHNSSYGIKNRSKKLIKIDLINIFEISKKWWI